MNKIYAVYSNEDTHPLMIAGFTDFDEASKLEDLLDDEYVDYEIVHVYESAEEAYRDWIE